MPRRPTQQRSSAAACANAWHVRRQLNRSAAVAVYRSTCTISSVESIVTGMAPSHWCASAPRLAGAARRRARRLGSGSLPRSLHIGVRCDRCTTREGGYLPIRSARARNRPLPTYLSERLVSPAESAGGLDVMADEPRARLTSWTRLSLHQGNPASTALTNERSASTAVPLVLPARGLPRLRSPQCSVMLRTAMPAGVYLCPRRVKRVGVR